MGRGGSACVYCIDDGLHGYDANKGVSRTVYAIVLILKQSDLVKLSKDEAEYLASQSGEHYQSYLKILLSMGVKIIVVTDGSQPVHVVSSSFSALVETPTIKAIDTTAAGDSFIASFLFALTNETENSPLTSSISSLEKVTKAALFAVKCGAYTCQQKGAFNALPSISDI